ncbi:fimbria/pilus outer membrane usher protein [Escherichia sp. TW14182]|uniref:fimbria/pilus outer membrane usher protein n=1 Tax=Escherichia sp. TW14182 TaxID=754336 RepID=UPI0002F83C0C
MKYPIKKSLLLIRITLLFPAFSWATVSPVPGSNGGYSFNPDFLQLSDGENAKNIDLNYFANASGAAPGQYTVDVIINGELVDSQVKIGFTAHENKLTATLTPQQLERWGIDIDKIPVSTHSAYLQNITQIIHGATENFDTNNQKLVLNIPQSYLKPQDWLSTPPHLWDRGMPALMINYLFNGMKQDNNGYSSRSQFLSLDSSLNLGGWRLRHNGNWSTNSYNKESHWQPVSVYLQHDYSFLQGGQFIVGQTSTDGEIFDSFPFEGVRFSSDDGMIAPELSQYSPVVRGIAYSQAQVSVKQNGVVIYQKNVPPGPFELRDFNQIFSGDLEVEIREADGSIRHFTQTTAVLPVLQRQGRLRYNLAFGKYRPSSTFNSSVTEPHFIQSSAAIGLPDEYTFYGGGIKADNYSALLLGIGKYSDFWGAFSLDIAHARSQFSQRYKDLGNQQGQSYRFMYSRGFGETNTTLNITGYHYATRGYYDFDELQQIQSGYVDDRNINSYHQRSRISTTINQDIQDWGQLYLSASKDQYWDTADGYNLSASYSPPFRYISAMLSFGYNKSPYYHKPDRSLFLSISVPLNSLLSGNNNLFLTSNTITNNGQIQQQVGLSGSTQGGEFTYAVAQGWQNQNKGKLGNVNLNYLGPYAQMSGGYAWQQKARQWTYGIGGGIALHPHGITLSQPLSLNSASALVQARDAANVRVLNGSGIYTDWRGYAVVPYLNPYNRNQISLDVNSAKDNIELLNTDVTVIPARGALVSAPFKVNVGNKAMITLIQKNGKPVPFGSLVTLDSENSTNSSIVADQGQVYMSGLPEEDMLVAQWGDDPSQQCKANYKLKNKKGKFNELTLRCQ